MSDVHQHSADSENDSDVDGLCLLDDQAITSVPYRLGDVFNVYDGSTSVTYKVTQIIERGSRRLTYGEPNVPAR